MDKKLLLYLVILAGLVTATIFAVRSSQNAEAGEMTANEMLLLEDTGRFEIDQRTDTVVPLFDEEEGITIEELANGEELSAETLTAFKKFQGVDDPTSPFVTFGLFIVTGIFTGFLIVTYVLPNFVQRASEEVLGSSERGSAADPVSQAQALVAQGKWDEAIEAYREAAKQDPDNRLPWVEMAMLQVERKENPYAALATLDEALERGGWRENDEAVFIFRKIDIHEEKLGNHDQAVALLREVIERFPETRHSANANHKLHTLGES